MGYYGYGYRSNMDTFMVIALLLAIVATVLAFIFIVPEKKRKTMGGFGKFLHDLLNFKFLIVEKILQATYIFSTVYVIFLGFFMLFEMDIYDATGIFVMLLGPIVVRLVYEFSMMVIILIKNVIQINKKLKNQNQDDKTQDAFSAFQADQYMTPGAPQNAAPQYVAPQYAAPAGPQAVYCPSCGAQVTDGSYCPVCGTRVG